MKTLGMRHIALNVKDAQVSKKFYMEFFGMDLEWQPDADNVYLTSNKQDNLALHKKEGLDINPNQQALDHLGFIIPTKEDVDAFYQRAKEKNIRIEKELKQHRDGAYSFYLKDPDGYVVQVIYHPPITNKL